MGMSSSQLTFICFRRVETTNQMKCWLVPTYSVKNIQSGIIKHGNGNREIPNFNCRQVIDDFPIQASIYRAGHVDPSGSHPVCEAEVPHLQSVGANLCTKPSAVWTGRIKVAASHRMATIRCILIPGMEVNIWFGILPESSPWNGSEIDQNFLISFSGPRLMTYFATQRVCHVFLNSESWSWVPLEGPGQYKDGTKGCSYSYLEREMMLKLNSSTVTVDLVDAWKTQRGTACRWLILVDQPSLNAWFPPNLKHAWLKIEMAQSRFQCHSGWNYQLSIKYHKRSINHQISSNIHQVSIINYLYSKFSSASWKSGVSHAGAAVRLPLVSLVLSRTKVGRRYWRTTTGKPTSRNGVQSKSWWGQHGMHCKVVPQ